MYLVHFILSFIKKKKKYTKKPKRFPSLTDSVCARVSPVDGVISATCQSWLPI